jgi:hypothetical protein
MTIIIIMSIIIVNHHRQSASSISVVNALSMVAPSRDDTMAIEGVR